MTRAGMSPALRARVRAADPDAREYLLAEIETNSDVVRTKDRWLTKIQDSQESDFDFDDDGSFTMARQADGTWIERTTGTTQITDLDREDPRSAAVVFFGGSDPEDEEIVSITAYLDPGNPTDVITWRMELWTVAKAESGLYGATPALFLVPIGTADVANNGATVAQNFTFDFASQRPKPKSREFFEEDPSRTDAINQPTLVVFIYALLADGSAATTGKWHRDTGDVTSSGNTLTGRTLTAVQTDVEVYRFTASQGAPRMSIKRGTYATGTKVADFTGTGGANLDLGATPTNTVEFGLRSIAPPGTTLLVEVRNDADTAWVTLTDGVTTDDLAGVGKNQTYRVRFSLTANTARTVSPRVVEVNVREIKTTDLSDVAVFAGGRETIDAVELKGSTGQGVIIALRDGVLDFRSRIEEVLTDNDPINLVFRRFIGAPGLARSLWLHRDDWILEDWETAGASVKIPVVSVLSKLRSLLPKYNSTTGIREPIAVSAASRKAAYDALLTTHIAVPARYIGPGVEEATGGAVAKRITNSQGKDEVDAIARLAGRALIASQGQIKAVDMLDRTRRDAFMFPSEEIEVLSVTPGYRARIPEYFVKFNVSEDAKVFSEIRRFHGPSLLKIGEAPFDGVNELDVEVAKWLTVQSMAETVAQNVVDYLGTGMIRVVWRSNYAYPEAEQGDIAIVETDRFLARDPLASRALKGNLFLRCVIIGIRDAWGREFEGWVRSYADVLSSVSTVTVQNFPVPEVLSIELAVANDGNVSAVIRTKDAGAVKFAHAVGTSPAFPTAATVRLETAVATDADGEYSTGTIRNLAGGQRLAIAVLAYAAASDTGSESTLAKALSDAASQNILGDIDINDGFSSAQNTAAPENGNVVITADGGVAYSNLEDANALETTYEVYYDIDGTGMDQNNLCTVEVYTNDGATSTTWTLKSSRTYDVTDNLTDEKQEVTQALDADYDIRIRLAYATAPGGNTATLTAHGEDHGTQPGVQYKKKGTRVSSSRIVVPVGTDLWATE